MEINRNGLRETAGLNRLAAPFFEMARRDLRAELQALDFSGRPFTAPSLVSVFSANLNEIITPILERTLVLEMHAARIRNELTGKTPEQRFLNYVEKLGCGIFVQRLFEEYPLLKELILAALEKWKQSNVALAGKLTRDWPHLQDYFLAGKDPGPLSEIAVTGDSHWEGKRVCRLTFASGFRLMYKPRSLAIDTHFYELLFWLNERRSGLAFRILKIWDRGDYGWEEFVPYQESTERRQIEAFYERLGGLLAVLFALEGTDFHYENLIAHGEHPVLFDLEALFHPRFENAKAPSLFRVGLLPQTIAQSGPTGIDISGCGGKTKQGTPFKQPFWKNEGTDEIQLTRAYGQMGESYHRPCGEQKAGYGSGTLERGFRAMYLTWLTHREKLLSENGPLARFGNDSIRVIARPTLLYSAMLRESAHPDLLRQSEARETFFCRLRECHLTSTHLAALIPDEIRALRQGNIPLFKARLESTDLYGEGGKVFPKFLPVEPRQQVENHIRSLSHSDLTRQIKMIRRSFSGENPLTESAMR